MRSKPPKKRTKSECGESPTENQVQQSPSVIMEMELLALRAKNAEIIQNNIKLRHTNDEQFTEIKLLRQNLLMAETRANRYAIELAKIKQDLEGCTPSFIQFMNLLIKHVDNRSINSDKVNNKCSSLSSGAKTSGVITQAVKPHMVNGAVLNVNPTISLTRLSTSETNSRPSTSSDQSFVTRRTARSTSDISDNEDENVCFDGVFDSQESPTVVENHQWRLSSISERTEDEEEEEAPLTSSQRTSEIRVVLSRLGDINSPNTTCSSMEGNIGNNTHYNIETTIIDNIARQRHGDHIRLISDYLLSSPRASSTMLSLSDNDVADNVSPSVALLTTPSLNAIGDIEGTKMNVFADLRMDVSPENTISGTPSRVISKRKTYSQRGSTNNSTRENMDKTFVPSSFVSIRSDRKQSNDQLTQPILTPRVILERLSITVPPSPRKTRSASKQNGENTDPSENNNNEEETKAIESKPPRRKRRKSSNVENDVSKRVKEMHVRLSNYSLLSTEHCGQQPQGSGIGRPQRAAKPKSLIESSLKIKMRRMF